MLQLRAKVIKNIEVTKNYYKIILSCARIARLAEPGQFLQVKLSEGDEPLLRRPLSVHRLSSQQRTAKKKPNSIELLYEVVGRATGILSQKKTGDYLDVIGPLGRGFDYSAQALKRSSAQVLAAGGMGVAPLMFLAEVLIKRNTIVLIGAKTKKHILCEEEFKKLGCTVRIATDDGSRGFKGKVTDLLRKVLRNKQYARRNTQIYACGPRPMLKEISCISQAQSIPAQISLEEHMACGIGACLGCVVKTQYARRNMQYEFQYKRVCKEGPVFNADEIIW